MTFLEWQHQLRFSDIARVHQAVHAMASAFTPNPWAPDPDHYVRLTVADIVEEVRARFGARGARSIRNLSVH